MYTSRPIYRPAQARPRVQLSRLVRPLYPHTVSGIRRIPRHRFNILLGVRTCFGKQYNSAQEVRLELTITAILCKQRPRSDSNRLTEMLYLIRFLPTLSLFSLAGWVPM